MNLSAGWLQCFKSSCKNILKWLESIPPSEEADKIRKEVEAMIRVLC